MLPNPVNSSEYCSGMLLWTVFTSDRSFSCLMAGNPKRLFLRSLTMNTFCLQEFPFSDRVRVTVPMTVNGW